MSCCNWSVLCGAVACALGCAGEPSWQASTQGDANARSADTLASSASEAQGASHASDGPLGAPPVQMTFFEHAQRLASAPAERRGRFGRSLSVYRNFAAVGAPDDVEPQAAKVFVYAREGDAWVEEAVLAAPGAQAAGFGAAVAIHQDRLVVGAPHADTDAQSRAGAAYIYERGSAGWTLRGALHPPDPQPWQAFGGQVALEYDRVVVGSVDRDYGSLEDAGAAYVYEREGELFNLVAELYAPTPQAHDKFGHALSILDARVVVSALRRDVHPHTDAGAVYMFERGRDGYGLTQVITAPFAQAGELFGASLSLSYVSGFAQRLVVGAPDAKLGDLEQAGAAYVFEAPERGDFVARETLFDTEPGAHAGFGEHVSHTRNLLLVGSRAKARAPKALRFTSEGASFMSDAALPLPRSEPCSDMTGPVALTSEHVFVGAWPSEAGSEPLLAGAVQVFRIAQTARETPEPQSH